MQTIDPTAAWTISIALALVFGASAALKLVDFDEFRAAVANYRIVPEALATPLSALIPVAEAAGAVGILIPPAHRAAAAILLILLGVFTAAIVINLMRGRLNVDCGCFGPALRQPLSWWLPARNALLMGLAAIAIMPSEGRAMTPLDVATIFFGAATIVVLYLAANYLIANLPRLRALETADA
ncbi:MAG TPA: MauE/DoxX family redox-associated membrane protein [Patescibacteria group bacterium]|nr:MauE/DoxX family redox-associated membrane protein [Patescibacteria group bacterium]